MKCWKRFAAVFLAGVMTLTGLSIYPDLPDALDTTMTAYADTYAENLTGESIAELSLVLLDDGTVSIAGCSTNATGMLVIPSVLNGMTVSAIGAYAFADCATLTGVQIPESVTSIGDCAFMNCTSLTEMTVPDTVIEVGGGVFCGCTQLSHVTLPAQMTALSSVRGEDSFVCYGFFEGCTALTRVEIPDSVTEIDMFAFLNCISLTRLELPKNLSRVADYAFFSCTALETVMFQTTLSHIGTMAFFQCSSLYDVYYTGTEKQWNNITIHSSGNDALTNASFHFSTVLIALDSIRMSESELAASDYMIDIPIRVENNSGFTSAAFHIAVSDPDVYLDAYSTSEANVVTTPDEGTLRCIFWTYAEAVTEETVGSLQLYLPADAAAGDVYTLSFYDMESGYLYDNSTEVFYLTAGGSVTITSDETLPPDSGTEDPIAWEIEDIMVLAGEEYVDLNVFQHNGTRAYIVAGTLYFPEATRKILMQPEGYSMSDLIQGGDAYHITQSAVNYGSYDTEGLMRFEFLLDGTVVPAQESWLASMTWGIADSATVEEVAQAYDIPRQTDPLGGAYYAFPVQWAEDGEIYLGQSGGIEAYQNRYGYYQNGYDTTDDIFSEAFELIDGEIRVYLDSIPEASVWSLDQMTVYPGTEYTAYQVNISGAVTSRGLQGALSLPPETAALLQNGYPLGAETLDCYYGIYGDMILSQNMEGAMDADLSENFIWFSMQSQYAAVPYADSGLLMDMLISIPDEATVIEIAKSYGMKASVENGIYYYLFLVNWIEPGTDTGYITENNGNHTAVERERYAYLNEDNVSLFPDYVRLQDGYIRVQLSGNPDQTQIVTTTKPDVTTTSVTTTITTTTTDTTQPPASTTQTVATTLPAASTFSGTTTETTVITTASTTESVTTTLASAAPTSTSPQTTASETVWTTAYRSTTATAATTSRPTTSYSHFTTMMTTQETAPETTAIDTTTAEEHMVFAIGSITGQAGQLDNKLNLYVENAVPSMGIRVALQLPGETHSLLDNCWAYGDETFMNSGVYTDMTLVQNIEGVLSGVDYGGTGIMEFALESADICTPAASDGILANIMFDLPSEERVLTVAYIYGLPLHQDGGRYYYDFPVRWAVRDTFSCLDENGQEIADTITFEDGMIRVYVSGDAWTTTTTVETTGVSTTTMPTTSRYIGTTATKGTPYYDTTTSTTTTAARTTTATTFRTTMPSAVTITAVPITSTTVSDTMIQTETTADMTTVASTAIVTTASMIPSASSTTASATIDTTTSSRQTTRHITTTSSESVTTMATTASTAQSTGTNKETDPVEETYLLGDVNQDGDINIQDSFLTLLAYCSVSAGLEHNLTQAQVLAADVDRDQELTIRDAFRILLYYAMVSVGYSPNWEELV